VTADFAVAGGPNAPLTLNGGVALGDGVLRTVSLGDDPATAGRLTLGGQVSGGAGLAVTGAGGALKLFGANTYSGGTTLNSGTIVVAGDSIGSTGPFGIGRLVIRPADPSGPLPTLADDGRAHTLSNPLILPDGSGAVAFGGTAALTFTGPVDLGASDGPPFAAPGVSRFTRTLVVTNTTTLAGAVGHGPGMVGDLYKSGSGTLVLAGPASYAGETRVVAGRLQVDGTLTAPAGPAPAAAVVTVLAGGTLGGGGTVGRPVTVSAGGTLAPGSLNSPGRLSVGAPVALAAGSAFAVRLNSTTAGAGYDQLDLTGGGSVALGGATLAATLGYAPASTDVLTIITGGPVSGTFAGLPDGSGVFLGSFGGTPYTATISYQPTAVVLRGFQPVPEPAGALLVCAAVVLAFRRRRQHPAAHTKYVTIQAAR
jgi:autotransporter-associated beta strand protein